MLKKKIITAIIATAMLASSACATAEEVKTTTETTSVTTNNFETWYVNAVSGLNCRSTPEVTDGNILTTYKHGTELQIIGIDDTGKWWQTWDGEIQGWCHSAYFVSEEPQSVDVADGAVGTYLGTFYGTGYTPSPSENGGWSVTAMGDNLWDVVGYAIATDPRVIPMNTKVYIKGIGYRVARDTGGAIKGNRIDILTSSNAESNAITGYYDVYLAE